MIVLGDSRRLAFNFIKYYNEIVRNKRNDGNLSVKRPSDYSPSPRSNPTEIFHFFAPPLPLHIRKKGCSGKIPFIEKNDSIELSNRIFCKRLNSSKLLPDVQTSSIKREQLIVILFSVTSL